MAKFNRFLQPDEYAQRFLPIFFHNLRGYDMHFLCKHGFGKFEDWKYEVIAQSREKFMRVIIKKDS